MAIESVRDIASRSRGVNFDWVSFEQNGAVFDYAAMVIRAREKNSQKIITFQLDTGARGNQLYELALADQLGYPASQPRRKRQEDISLGLVFDGDVGQEINFALRKNYGEQQGTSQEVPEICTLALAFLGEDGFTRINAFTCCRCVIWTKSSSDMGTLFIPT